MIFSKKDSGLFLPLTFAGLLGLLSLLCLNQTSYASDLNFPPSAELIYTLKSSQKGIPISGTAKVSWQQEQKDQKRTYQITSETTVMLFGKILNTSSVGEIKESGLAPQLFQEKRYRRPLSTTNFNHVSKRITFSESELSYPLKGGEQDRLSATWQLVALARSSSEPIKPGQEWSMFVAGLRDGDPWTFKVVGLSTMTTVLGDIEVVQIRKIPHPDSPTQQLELWLAKDHDYYPVRVSFHDANGDHVDQRLKSITK